MSEQTDDPYPPIPITETPDTNPPDFDMDKYMKMAGEFDMSEEEKRELILTLWNIMSRFVELGFGLDSVSILEAEKARKASAEAAKNPSDSKGSVVE
jgi:hypothetical protein